VAAEEQLKARLSEANLASAANVTNTNAGKVSRTRLKIAEVKMLETKLEEEGKVLVDNSQSPVNNKTAPVTQNMNKAGQSPLSLKVEPTAPASAQPIAASTVGAPVATGGASSKWSTDLNSLGKFDVNAKSTSVDPVGKVPTFTSSFLGKAIDLGGSPGSQRAPPPEVKSPSEQRIEAAMHAAMTKSMTSVTASGKPAALAPPSNHASGISVLNAAPVAHPNSSSRGGPPPPVIQGRRPPPNAPPSAEVGEVTTGASATRHISTPAARLPYADGSDDNEDEYGERVEEDEGEGYDEADSFFQEADDAALPEERDATAKVYPVRGLPLPKVPSASSSHNDVNDEEEEEGVERYDSAGELQRDDSNADFDQLYGTRRRAPTVEDDDDLEELSTARSQLRTQSRNSGADERTADTTTATSSTPSPVLDTSPLPTHTAAEEHMMRMPSIDENDASEGPPGSRRGSLQQDGDRDRVERKLDYVTVDPLPAAEESPREEDGEGDRDEDAQEGLEGHDGEEDPEDADQEREADEKTQIRVLRSHAKVLEGLKDIPAAEAVHMRALELDPTNIATLEGFAMFLHQKKGELARAEAFFNRGLQVCLPGLSLRTSATNTPTAEHKKDKMAQSGVSFGTDASMQGNKITHIVRFIMSYAHFMNKSKGDIEAAGILYRKGIELAPENALLLATYAHFLAQLGDKESSAAAMEYFQKALKFSPGNGQYCMWYGKLLKKMGKVGQAELMYKVALEQSKGNETLEPTAICNYATFVFKQRKDPVRAHALFIKGLESFPTHKGLRKNHGALLKACPQVVGGEGAPAAPQQQGEQKEPSKGAARAEWLARRAQRELRDQAGATVADLGTGASASPTEG
jgi:tetratricopeptide (TPR) repeat protein